MDKLIAICKKSMFMIVCTLITIILILTNNSDKLYDVVVPVMVIWTLSKYVKEVVWDLLGIK
jgi:hypothetical protein